MKCPVCEALIEPERVDERLPLTPAAGSVVVCEGCAMPLIVDELGGLLKPDLDEYDAIMSDPVTAMVVQQALSAAIAHADDYTRQRAPWTRRLDDGEAGR